MENKPADIDIRQSHQRDHVLIVMDFLRKGRVIAIPGHIRSCGFSNKGQTLYV